MSAELPPDKRIPFNRPSLIGREYEYIGQALASGWISGDGQFTKRCNQLLETALTAPKVLLTTSCTHALELAALLLELAPGDEVLVPSFTFVSTVNPFVLRGARPRFVDIRPDTLNVDESLIEPLIGPRTRALAIVHYAGVACAMEPIIEICNRRGLALIEDNAHGPFCSWQGRPLGTFGRLASLSFHETKNFTCGEGGALVINDPSLIERAEIIREKGTDRSRFFRGLVDKYTWVDLGSSYLPAELNAAFLLAQLEARETIQAARRAIWERYARELADWAAAHDVGPPGVPAGCDQSYHMFYMLLPTAGSRDRLLVHLKQRNIGAAFHYLPLHQSRMGSSFGARPEDCPITNDVSGRLIRLPFYNHLNPSDQLRVIEAVRAFQP